MEPNVLPPEEDQALYNTLKDDKQVKKVERVVPYFPKFKLIDVSLKARSFDEDGIFAESQFYRETIRRGLSFFHEENIGTAICRRGLQKFFDLRSEYFEVLDGTAQLDSSSVKLKKVEKELYHVIFDDVVKTLNEGGKVSVYKTEKANGENAQVSYNKRHDAWIVASKNVSMMVRKPEDIEEYRGVEEQRYSIAIMIAEAWFDILKKCGKDIEELKKDMLGKTLVGEYCGHPMYQHLVRYDSITIFFFAMVDLHGKRTCYPINMTQDLLRKYNLPMVKIALRRECANVKEVIEVLKELTKEVAQNPVEEDAEGCVVYFEGRHEDRREIYSLCKVKTLEYRFYRKLREKLKNFLASPKGNQPAKTVEEVLYKYKTEVKSLSKDYNTPKPLEYYCQIAELALKFVSDNTEMAKKVGLTRRYLEFLTIVQECKAKGEVPTVRHFKELIEKANELSDESDPEDEEQGGRKKPPQGKVEEEKKVEGQVQGNQSRKRVVVVMPPLYLDQDLGKKIKEKTKVSEVETDWDENKPFHAERSVALVHRFPEVTGPEKLGRSTFIVVTGFDKEALKKALGEVEIYLEDKKRDPSLVNPMITKFLESVDQKKGIDDLWPEYERFSEHVKKVLPNNSLVSPILDAKKIIEEIEIGFQRLENL